MTSRDLAVDRLPHAGPPLEVVWLEGARFGAAGRQGPRDPHRHDYHELIWCRTGEGRHLIDETVTGFGSRTVTLIGRGQVHVFEHATGVDGAVVRFGDDALSAHAGWLLGRRGAQIVAVPDSDVPRLDAVVEALAAEVRRPADPRSVDLQRHLLSVLLLWVERWYDAARIQRRGGDDAEVQVYRRFVDVLERDFARHHDVGHYADALGVPAAALSQALARATGRTTKELVTDRVMVEAARLLRFTDLSVGEVAFRAGFTDQLYFSRAFKRHTGLAPSAYRERSMHPREESIRSPGPGSTMGA